MKRFTTKGVVSKTTPTSRLASAFMLILSTFLLATSASAAELVVNGGFELPIVDPDLGWTTYYGENYPLSEPGDCDQLDPAHPSTDKCNDDTRVPGWSVFWTDDLLNHQQLTPGRLEIQTGTQGGVAACDCSLQKAELDSHHRIGDDNNNVTIAQWLPTCPLTAYKLTYGWKSRTEIPGDNDVRVVIGTEQVNIHQQNMEWEMEDVHFISDNSYETLLLFGSIGDETTTGMFLDDVSVTGPDGSLFEPCTLVCDDKPIELTLRYDGNDFSDHDQTGSEVIISPEVVPSFPTDAVIEVYGHKWKSPKLLGTFDVSIDGFFTVKGPQKRIPPRLTFKIYHPDDLKNPVQTVTFHTSCSQPMNAGDEFGAITVWSAIN